MLTHRKNQESRILEILIRAHGAWVPAPELAQVSLQYGRAVYHLRKLKFVIENEVRIDADGARRGFFRLIRRPSPPHQAARAPAPADVEAAPALFGDLAGGRPDPLAECSSGELHRQRRACR